MVSVLVSRAIRATSAASRSTSAFLMLRGKFHHIHHNYIITPLWLQIPIREYPLAANPHQEMMRQSGQFLGIVLIGPQKDRSGPLPKLSKGTFSLKYARRVGKLGTVP